MNCQTGRRERSPQRSISRGDAEFSYGHPSYRNGTASVPYKAHIFLRISECRSGFNKESEIIKTSKVAEITKAESYFAHLCSLLEPRSWY
jgi:hypothetical protein